MTDDAPHPPPDSTDPTLLQEDRPESRPSSSGSLAGGRFAPGTVLDGRYRIVDLLGRGGMGEVYRAEDLKLGETVALKFLPEALAADGAALAHLHREVRLARRITHKNVVRVHDVGEADGTTFLAMEYVDGENLASLLKRIGRLPEAKALELARQLCAGLAAAHEGGLVHRDLKPANVMIDGEGRAKISDFGLVGLAAELERPELAGTPLYMAPEQLAEGRASFASDVYSLGLVLYEMFSGRRPFAAASRDELRAAHRDTDPPSLSSAVETVDPLVERAVAACLRHDPARRPESSLAVAAALPGGDPLAAALAAGETPSPEMVARATGQGALSRPLAAGLLGLTLAGIAVLGWYSARYSAVQVDRPLERAVLEYRALELLDEVGWGRTDYTRVGFQIDAYHRRAGTTEEEVGPGWAEAPGRPALLGFWLRAADRPLTPQGPWQSRVDVDDPPPDTPGVATVRLDSQGRLAGLLLPPARQSIAGVRWSPLAKRPDAAAESPDWRFFFDAAGLEASDFQPVEPQRAPPFWAERLVAWEGAYPGQESPRLAVDAAVTAGSVVWWQVVEEPLLEVRSIPTPPQVVLALVGFALMILLGGWLARRNLVSGRGDRRGALRLAAVLGGGHLVAWVVSGSHAAHFGEISRANLALARAALLALAIWLLYVALEPYARRLAPRRLTSWARLLDGRFSDPLVGRDLLIGIGATSAVVAGRALQLAPEGTVVAGFPHGLRPLYGPAAVFANIFSPMMLLVPLGLAAVFVAVRAVVRSDRWAPAAALVGLFLVTFAASGFQRPLVALLNALLITFLAGYVGLLGLLGFAIVQINVVLVPISLDPSVWWAPNSWIGVAVVVLLAVWGYRCATRPGVRGARERP